MHQKRAISGSELRTQAHRIAAMLNEHMLEFPDNNDLLQHVLAAIFGSTEKFEELFYQHLTEAQKYEFQQIIDSLAEDQRNKKTRIHNILSAAGFSEIINKLRQVQLGKATKALNNPESFTPDSTPYNADAVRRHKEQQQKK